jgi:RNA polymerase sporulation-specific sigma factor
MDEKLLKSHLPMIHSIINGFYVPHGLEREDLVQAGLIGVWKACKKYKARRNVQFSTYAYSAARNEILSLLRKQSRYKPEQFELPETGSSYEIEKSIIDKFIKEDLEHYEGTIIQFLYEGYTQREIAKMLNTTQPRICQRIRELRIKGKRKWGNVT